MNYWTVSSWRCSAPGSWLGAGSLYSAWILSFSPAAALLGFLILRVKFMYLLQACATFQKGHLNPFHLE